MCGITPIHLPAKESPPCDVKHFDVIAIQFNKINYIHQPLASQVHPWWLTVNFGNHIIEPVCFYQTPMKATNITIEYIASLVWTQAPPWASPTCPFSPRCPGQPRLQRAQLVQDVHADANNGKDKDNCPWWGSSERVQMPRPPWYCYRWWYAIYSVHAMLMALLLMPYIVDGGTNFWNFLMILLLAPFPSLIRQNENCF